MKPKIALKSEPSKTRTRAIRMMISPRATLAFSALAVKQRVWALLKRCWVQMTMKANEQHTNHLEANRSTEVVEALREF